jgi:hypothetical protein
LFFGTVDEVEPPPIEEARVVVVVVATFDGPEPVERSMRYVAPTKRIKIMRTTPMAG